MSFGEKIRQLREAKGMSQADLAKAVGYKTRSSIAKIESDESDPSQKMLLKLANALEVSPGDLILEEAGIDIHKTANAITASYGFQPMSDARRNLLRLVQMIPDDKVALLSSIVQSILEDARKGS